MALGNAREDAHDSVEELFGRYREQNVPRHTTDYVLDELSTLLFQRVEHGPAVTFMEGIFETAGTGRLRIHRVTSERFHDAWALRKRFDDKPEISFTDLTSMVVMEELGLQGSLRTTNTSPRSISTHRSCLDRGRRARTSLLLTEREGTRHRLRVRQALE